MTSRLLYIGLTLVLTGLAGAGLTFLWMQHKAPPSVAARTAGTPVTGSPAATTPVASRTTIHVQPLTLLFDFDRTTLQPAAAARLDRLTNDMKGTRVGRVTAAGHADRIGSDAYNLVLAQRRAEMVMSYVASKGMDAAAFEIVSNGERLPASGDDCQAASSGSANAQLLECLQPDRRVVITVHGAP